MVNFDNKIKKEFNANLSYINKFKPFYFFPHYHIEENRRGIEKFVNPYQPLYFSLWDKKENDIIFKIGNTSMLPAKVKKIEITDNNDQLSVLDLSKEKNYFKARLFKEPIEYEYLNFNLDFIILCTPP